MATKLERTGCCGLRELQNIEDSKTSDEILKTVYPKWTEWRGAFMVFSCLVSCVRGERLEQYILKNELGNITKSPKIETPEGDMYTYVFEVDTPAYSKWYQAKINKTKSSSCPIMAGCHVKALPNSNGRYSKTNEANNWQGVVIGVINIDTICVQAPEDGFSYDVDKNYFECITHKS